MSLIIRWENPPPRKYAVAGDRRCNYDYDSLVAELKKRPGQYAVIQEDNYPVRYKLVHSIRSGRIAAFKPAGDFDACARIVNGVDTVYVAYFGDGDGEEVS